MKMFNKMCESILEGKGIYTDKQIDAFLKQIDNVIEKASKVKDADERKKLLKKAKDDVQEKLDGLLTVSSRDVLVPALEELEELCK